MLTQVKVLAVVGVVGGVRHAVVVVHALKGRPCQEGRGTGSMLFRACQTSNQSGSSVVNGFDRKSSQQPTQSSSSHWC